MSGEFDFASFERDFNISVKSRTESDCVLDIRGIDAPLANALRRIILDEVPTIAIDKVVIYQNTSVMPDEVLAHRLGLIPIRADPDSIESKADSANFDEKNSLKFYLKAVGGKETTEVLAREMEWQPVGAQKEAFPDGFRPLFEDVLITKLGHQQEIEVEIYCTKNIGKVHTKWSPVSTVYYRLMPVVKLREDITNEEADAMKATCPVGVFDIEEVGKGKRLLRVAHQSKCTTCRACIADPKNEKKIELLKELNHYEFTIESVGTIDPLHIFLKAIEILSQKAVRYEKEAKQILKKGKT